MKKTFLFTIAIFIALLFIRCDCPGSTSGPDKVGLDSLEYPQMSDYVVTKPEKVKVYVDASGSMRGYFSEGSDGRFISAISNADANETVWMDANFTPIEKPLNSALLKGTLSGADSRFDNMISRICEDLRLDSLPNLGLLFTDGIISSSASQTKRNSTHTVKSFTELKNDIKKELDNHGLAVSLLRLESKFDGHYWDYQNNDAGNIVIENRPFYVIAIGNPEVVRYFIANNELGAEQEAWGIYNDVNRKHDEKYVLTPLPASDWNGNEFIGKKDIKFSLPLPKYVCDLGWDNIQANSVIELNGNDITGIVDLQPNKNAKSIDGVLVSWNTDPAESKKAPVLIPTKNVLLMKIMKNDKSSFYTDELSCEDDLQIATDTNLQKQTFGLKYLRDGLREGVGEGAETVVFKVQKIFKVTNNL